MMFHLPNKTTLRSYTGKSTGEVGFTPLVERRLEMEKKKIDDDRKLIGNLQIDGMTTKKGKRYHRNFGRTYGNVDMGGIVQGSNALANQMLCFVFTGMQDNYKIPVAHFFVNKLTAEQQFHLTIYVIQKLGSLGYKMQRVVTDNLSTNTKMFTLFNDGSVSCSTTSDRSGCG